MPNLQIPYWLTDPAAIIHVLVTLSLGGLLFSIGLRLRLSAVMAALRTCRLAWILPLNFIVVPGLTWALGRGLRIPDEIMIGMLLLAAAPFAPVVPVFIKMARGHLALAAGLTALFPLFSTFVTPVVCEISLAGFMNTGPLRFSSLSLFTVLLSTITLPLTTGMVLGYAMPSLANRLLRPVEVLSEAAGALSLIVVTSLEFRSILMTGWKPLLAMALIGEISFFLGHHVGSPFPDGRRVMAFGTSNRNIGLALLIAVDSFAGTPVVAAVVANGLLLIFLGLLHVGYYRFLCADLGPAVPSESRAD